ncbi:U-scoloptoxin(11)-Sa2a-like isoform X2 [Stegodyphus dumicola]|uniref:U-scoloptoxin(11)-Sa2a-like isoform X2 n=1 Tax=Stegodyphus dumicola TaxID=202533 RepID=UPI0015B0D81E|nr:U-scoloptoxin(11)-Sa2a-like isoform X2 [Stegodyphus dumicola]
MTAHLTRKNEATSERNLPLCTGPREACNIVRLRFWLSPIVYRLCKCPDLTDCPMEWMDTNDKRTISLNVRAQLKFCSQVAELEPCEESQSVAAEIRSNGTISINCFCGPGNFFHKLYNTTSGQYFACLPFGSCQNGDFCGHVTSSSYETYHICTCPAKHICILQNRKLVHAHEILYIGQAYEGFCTPREI